MSAHVYRAVMYISFNVKKEYSGLMLQTLEIENQLYYTNMTNWEETCKMVNFTVKRLKTDDKNRVQTHRFQGRQATGKVTGNSNHEQNNV